MSDTFKDVEIMAPAGSYESLSAAIRSGAHSVYFGVDKLNMRARSAHPFTLKDLKHIARLCRSQDVKSYLALNTLIYDDEFDQIKEVCLAAREAGISAVIAADMAAILCARELGLEVHTSVQANISNYRAARFYAQYADVIVLARELTLEQIRAINNRIEADHLCGPSGQRLRTELFVHGALCVAVAGKCYMSLGTYHQSANRGACYQNCRRKYRVMDDETGDELVVDNQYIMSPRDLCMIQHLDLLLNAGVRVLKIEGRGRKADYVATTVRCYREAVEAVGNGTYTKKKTEQWLELLKTVFNRGFWEGGYYYGAPLGEWSGRGHSQATIRRVQIGTVSNYYSRAGVAEFSLKLGTLEPGAEILFEGATTGAVRWLVESLYVAGKPAALARKGDEVTVSVPEKVRRNDKVFLHLPRRNGGELSDAD